MNRFKSTKVVALISIVLMIFQTTLPIVSAEQQATTTTNFSESTLNQESDLPLQSREGLASETTKESSQDSTQDSTENSRENKTAETTESTSEIREAATEASQTTTTTSENEAEEQSDEDQVVKTQGETASSNDLSTQVKVKEWQIFETSYDDPLSATKAASVETNYNLRFTWSLTKENQQFIKAGEYFCLDLPENVGIAAEGIEGWGFWSTSTTGKFDLEAVIDGTTYRIGQWWVDWREDGSPRGKYYIKVLFGADVAAANVTQIEGIQFNLPQGALKNMTIKGGIQEVYFGGEKKRIKFEQAKENHSEGDDYKYSSKAGSNTITFDVGIGRMTLNELAGDKVDYAVNSEKGLYLDGDYHGYLWGENLTELNDIYVEDTLDAGVVVSSLSLSALVQAPIGLTEENRKLQSGGLINRDVATFESYLFADYGNGPVYRSAGSNQEIQFPKQEYSYKLIVQEEGETLAAFRARVKEVPHQYGIYTAGSGKTAQRTICINIGDIHKGASVQPKYSELTDQAYATSAKEITRNEGSVLSAASGIKITQFAVEATNNAIKHGLYTEDDRALLEEFYTLAYGDSNVINGQASAFNISMTLSYPLDENLGEEKSNTALAYYENAKQQQDPSFKIPGELTGTGTMSNPYAQIAINTNTIALVKYDGITLKEMNGVEFELQTKIGENSWEKVDTYETADFTTADGEKISGVIQVSGLGKGTYRFVEKTGANQLYPEGYNQTESSFWNPTEQRIISEEIVVDQERTNAPVMIDNIPLASAPYAVEHYFLKEGRSTDSTNPDDFELNFVENETGEDQRPIGSLFTGTPRTNLLGYSYKKIPGLELASGEITKIKNPNLSYRENGQLVLRFYYVPDEDSIPFTITKLDATGKPMPSYDSQGNPLDTEVSFYIYEFNWGSGKGPDDPGAEPTKGESNAYWKLVEKDSDGQTLQQPIKTDSQGRLRAKIDLTDNGAIGNAKTFAIVEATNTYPNYEAPSVETAWWFLWTGTGKEGEAPKGTFSWCNTKGSKNPGCDNIRQADGSVLVSLKNKPKPTTLKFYKADQDKNMMPSDSEKKKVVKFQFYKYIGSWDGSGPINKSLDDSNSWEFIGIYNTDENGKILDYELDDLGTFALKEVSSYPNFAVPSGFWILWTSWVTEGIVNHKAEYVQGSNDDPGALQYDDPDNPTNSTVLLNREVKQEFSFIKENEQGAPLGEVEFAIYQGKENEQLEIGVNDDPAAANTYWEMSQPFKKAISNAAGSNQGKVTFDLSAGTYLLVETKTAPGYQLPQGQWILTIDPLNNDANQKIKIQARGSSLPPAFYQQDGMYHLPNIREYHLPSAGAGGVLLYVVFGIVLIGSAVLVGQSKKTTKKKAD